MLLDDGDNNSLMQYLKQQTATTPSAVFHNCCGLPA